MGRGTGRAVGGGAQGGRRPVAGHPGTCRQRDDSGEPAAGPPPCGLEFGLVIMATSARVPWPAFPASPCRQRQSRPMNMPESQSALRQTRFVGSRLHGVAGLREDRQQRRPQSRTNTLELDILPTRRIQLAAGHPSHHHRVHVPPHPQTRPALIASRRHIKTSTGQRRTHIGEQLLHGTGGRS